MVEWCTQNLRRNGSISRGKSKMCRYTDSLFTWYLYSTLPRMRSCGDCLRTCVAAEGAPVPCWKSWAGWKWWRVGRSTIAPCLHWISSPGSVCWSCYTWPHHQGQYADHVTLDPIAGVSRLIMLHRTSFLRSVHWSCYIWPHCWGQYADHVTLDLITSCYSTLWEAWLLDCGGPDY